MNEQLGKEDRKYRVTRISPIHSLPYPHEEEIEEGEVLLFLQEVVHLEESKPFFLHLVFEDKDSSVAFLKELAEALET